MHTAILPAIKNIECSSLWSQEQKRKVLLGSTAISILTNYDTSSFGKSPRSLNCVKLGWCWRVVPGLTTSWLNSSEIRPNLFSPAEEQGWVSIGCTQLFCPLWQILSAVAFRHKHRKGRCFWGQKHIDNLRPRAVLVDSRDHCTVWNCWDWGGAEGYSARSDY